MGWKQAGGGLCYGPWLEAQPRIQFGHHQTHDLEGVVGRPCRRFEVAAVERGEEVAGQHRPQPHHQDGVGLVPVNARRRASG